MHRHAYRCVAPSWPQRPATITAALDAPAARQVTPLMSRQQYDLSTARARLPALASLRVPTSTCSRLTENPADQQSIKTAGTFRARCLPRVACHFAARRTNRPASELQAEHHPDRPLWSVYAATPQRAAMSPGRRPIGICEGAGLVKGVRARALTAWCVVGFVRACCWGSAPGCRAEWCSSAARHLSAPFGAHGAVGPRPARTQSVRRRRHRGGSHADSESLGVVSELHAAARCSRQRISPSRRP